MSRQLELLRCLVLWALNTPCESVYCTPGLWYSICEEGNHVFEHFHPVYCFCAPEASCFSVSQETEASTQCAQHPLLHPPDSPTLDTRPPCGSVTHPISTVTGHRALLSTTLSLRRISPTTAFQAMTLTVVVGPAAGCNCGLAARPLLHSRVRSLGDRPHTLCQRRCLTEACEGTGLLLRPPI